MKTTNLKVLTLFCKHPPLLRILSLCSSSVWLYPGFACTPGWTVGRGRAGLGGRHRAQQEPATDSKSPGAHGRSGHGALEQLTIGWPVAFSCQDQNIISNLDLRVNSCLTIFQQSMHTSNQYAYQRKTLKNKQKHKYNLIKPD